MEYTYELRSGVMPNTDYKYEELEAFFASYYLTFLHLKDSENEKRKEMFRIINDELTRLAISQKVQIPEDAVKNSRVQDANFRPRKMESFLSVKDSFRAFMSDFCLVNENDVPYRDSLVPAMHLHLILCGSDSVEKYYFE